jgi:hypothetical protein
MVFFHIDTKNYKDKDKNGKTDIDKLNKFIHSNKNNKIFIIYYMEGCGPCNATRPEWAKMKNVLKTVEDSNDIAIVDIDQVLSSKLKGLKEPSSFPTMTFITNGGQEVENYEDSNIRNKDRTIDSFVEWIDVKSGKQKGGILVNNIKNQDAFNEFIMHSSVKYLSKGANGITFIATIIENINDSYKSQYSYMNPNNYGEPVTKILLKLIFIDDDFDEENDNGIKMNSLKEEFFPTTNAGFTNEVNIQTDIFLKSMNYLQPICPAVVYADIVSGPNSSTKYDKLLMLLNLLTNRTQLDNKGIFQDIKRNYQFNNFKSIGLICMEFADGYYPLHSLVSDVKFNLYKNMALYLLLRLALETGYTHSDFHPGNIMINVNDKLYFKGFSGSPILIDFGYTQKIPLDNLAIIKENYDSKKYTDALKELCKIRRPDKLSMNKYKEYYGWVCGQFDYKTQQEVSDFDSNVNSLLNELVIRREDSINYIVDLFNKKHAEDPNKYPLLPLSNAVKNSIFEGLIGGKKRNIKNKKTKKSNKTKRLFKSKKIGGKWSLKYKRSINCRKPKGFSQKQYCKYGRK